MIYSKIMIKLMQIKAPKSRPIRPNWVEYEHFWYTYKGVTAKFKDYIKLDLFPNKETFIFA